MGRVSRYKKIKAVDPFAKGGRGMNEAAPAPHVGKVPASGDAEKMPRRLSDLLRAKKALARRTAGQAGNSSVVSSHAVSGTAPIGPARVGGGGGSRGVGSVPALVHTNSSGAAESIDLSKQVPMPGESLQSFRRRLKDMLFKQLAATKAAAPIMVRPVSAKRKAYQLARAEAKKAKRRRIMGLPELAGEFSSRIGGSEEEDNGADFGTGRGAASAHSIKRPRATDDTATSGVGDKRLRTDEFPVAEPVRFGERAERPPTISAAPRKSKARKAAEALFAAKRSAAAEAEAGGSGEDAEERAAAAKSAARASAMRALELERLRAASYAALGKAASRTVLGSSRTPL